MTSIAPNPVIATGLSNFKDLVFKSDIFVDKSLFIKELLNNGSDVVLIARPRRWGKSMNLSMLEHFFKIEVDKQGLPLPLEDCVNRKLFLGGKVDTGFGETKQLKPLKIATEFAALKKQGRVPVILIDFKEAKGSTLDEILSSIKHQVIALYSKYRYLEKYLEHHNSILSDTEKRELKKYFTGDVGLEEVKSSLKFLSQLLCLHFGRKVYILIDEYDTPLNFAYTTFGLNSLELEALLLLFRGMFGAALKGNDFLEKGVITGILRIAKANLFSDLNNVTENTLLDVDFAQSYGFTQAEVDELLSHYSLDIRPEKIKHWYNGYTLGGEIIYNPWSITRCLNQRGELAPYWIDSGGTGLVNKALLNDEVQAELQDLLACKSITKKIYRQIAFEDIQTNHKMLYSLLLFAGYLNPKLVTSDELDESEVEYELSIPNHEVKQLYLERVQYWVAQKLSLQIDKYEFFVDLLRKPNLDLFAEKFAEFLVGATSYHDASEEKHYHSLMNGLLASLANKYIQKSNQESGLGRFDHLLIPREGRGDTALIFEYKVAKSSQDLERKVEEAFAQIDLQKYLTILKDFQVVKKVYKVAIAFCGKEMKLQYALQEN
jgi:hypothetical protein